MRWRNPAEAPAPGVGRPGPSPAPGRQAARRAPRPRRSRPAQASRPVSTPWALPPWPRSAREPRLFNPKSGLTLRRANSGFNPRRAETSRADGAGRRYGCGALPGCCSGCSGCSRRPDPGSPSAAAKAPRLALARTQAVATAVIGLLFASPKRPARARRPPAATTHKKGMFL